MRAFFYSKLKLKTRIKKMYEAIGDFLGKWIVKRILKVHESEFLPDTLD